MKTMLYTFLFACPVFLSGCSGSRQIPEDLAGEAEPLGMIQIQNVLLTDKTLALDYRVSNPFDSDIRVCHAAWVYGNLDVRHATTRIRDNTVRIILGSVVNNSDVEKDPVIQDPPPIAKYVRLAPGESYSGRVVLDLPMRDYSLEPAPRSRRPREENVDITLRRAVFEVGYFGPRLNKFFDVVSEEIKEKGIEPKPTPVGPFYYLTTSPLIVEEMQDGQAREVMYVKESWAAHTGVESARVVLATDVAIPCSVPDDK
ncbi:MAG: hypothetical protein ACYSWO_20175 [Planctomycetota bacterium]